MPEKPGARWYVLQVRIKHESVVATRLRAWGIDAFLPRRSIVRDSSTSVGGVLFPGYVFCRLTIPTKPKLYQIPGVIRILGLPRQPTPIDDEEIEKLRFITESMLPVEVHPYHDWKPSESAVLTSGPLIGISGAIQQIGERSTIMISFPSIGCSISISISPEWIDQFKISPLGRSDRKQNEEDP